MKLDSDSVDIILSLHCFFSDVGKIILWLNTKNPCMGEVAPIDMINAGRGKKLLKWVNEQLDSNKPV